MGSPFSATLSQAWVPGSVPLPRYEGEARHATCMGPSCFFQASLLLPLSSLVNTLPFPVALGSQTQDPGGTCSGPYLPPASPRPVGTKTSRASASLEKRRDKGKARASPTVRVPCVLEPETLNGGPLCPRAQQVQCAFHQFRCAALTSHPLHHPLHPSRTPHPRVVCSQGSHSLAFPPLHLTLEFAQLEYLLAPTRWQALQAREMEMPVLMDFHVRKVVGDR